MVHDTAEIKTSLRKLPETARQVVTGWLDDPGDALVPEDWSQEFRCWKEDCVGRLTEHQRAIDLLLLLEGKCRSLPALLDLCSQYWYVFRMRESLPTNWDPQKIEDLEPIIYHEVNRFSEERIPKEQVHSVLECLRSLLEGPKALRPGSGRVERFDDKVFLNTLKGFLLENCPKIKSRVKVMEELLEFFFPDRFQEYTTKNIWDLLEGFDERMGG